MTHTKIQRKFSMKNIDLSPTIVQLPHNLENMKNKVIKINDSG